MSRIYVGIDIGKTHHHVAVINHDGVTLSSERIDNDQAAIAAMIGRVGRRHTPTIWAVDLRGGPVKLLLTLLSAKNADVRYINGRVTAGMAGALHGEQKTDARDAIAIAIALHVNPNAPRITSSDPVQEQLKLLVARRNDLVEDRIRLIWRLQDLLTSISPALERILDLTNKGPVLLLMRWQTPAMLRRAGRERILQELRDHRIHLRAQLTEKVITAAHAQTAAVPAEATAAVIVAQLATTLHSVNGQITELETMIKDVVVQHELAEVIISLPGMGPILAAELIAHIGNLDRYRSPASLAAHAGLAPVSRDSGNIQGHQLRPNRYHRRLRWVFSMSTLSSLRLCRVSRTYYDRKRAEGKTHRQAAAALSRRRVNVLWACIRDRQPYQPRQPRTTPEAVVNI